MQVGLLNNTISTISAQVTQLASLHIPPNMDRQESGMNLSNTQNDAIPSPTNATPTITTLPAVSEVSTASSSTLYQGLSSLWVQLIVSRFILHLYGRDETAARPNCPRRTQTEGHVSDGDRCTPIRISLEVESVSTQVDVQEKCTDCILKVSSVDCSFCKLVPSSSSPSASQSPGTYRNAPSFEHHNWVPYLENSNGKLFSSTGSNLSDKVLQLTAPGLLMSQLQASGEETVDIVYSPSQHRVGSTFQPSFLYVKGHLPRGRSHVTTATKRVKVEVGVSAFEAVVWVPAFRFVLSLLASEKKTSKMPLRGMLVKRQLCNLCV